MTNDFSNISSESNLRDEITVRSDEYDPVANPAYDGPMGVMTDYDGCDSDEYDPVANPAYDGPMGVMTDYDGCDSDDEGENLEDEGTVTEPDESMDGDFDSGMASAGFGMDEDYGYYGGGEE